MSSTAEFVIPRFQISKQCEITDEVLKVLRAFGFGFSDHKTRPVTQAPEDALTMELAHFFQFTGVNFQDDSIRKIELLSPPEPLDLDLWCQMVLTVARVIERELAPNFKVECESYNSLEYSLRKFIYSFGEAGKKSIPPSVPNEWRYQENRDRLKKYVDTYFG